jgi:uncharacterized protein
MQNLENLYEFSVDKITFTKRKSELIAENTIITGPPRCGKTYLIFQFLTTLSPDSYLYIDLLDKRLNDDDFEELDDFLQKNEIKVLIIDNWYGHKITQLDIITIYSGIDEYQLTDFKSITMHALTFQEYCDFESHHRGITQQFNAYLRHGTLPEIVNFPLETKAMFASRIIDTIYDEGVKKELFIYLLKQIGSKLTTHQIYTTLKQEIKISKDKCYAYLKELQEEKVVMMVAKENESRAAKKIYVYDFGLRDVVTFSKKFISIIENVIFLELFHQYDKIIYNNIFDFVIPEASLGIVVMPFASSSIINIDIERYSKQKNISKVRIITMSFEQTFEHENLDIKAMPFSTWALS